MLQKDNSVPSQTAVSSEKYTINTPVTRLSQHSGITRTASSSAGATGKPPTLVLYNTTKYESSFEHS